MIAEFSRLIENEKDFKKNDLLYNMTTDRDKYGQGLNWEIAGACIAAAGAMFVVLVNFMKKKIVGFLGLGLVLVGVICVVVGTGLICKYVFSSHISVSSKTTILMI